MIILEVLESQKTIRELSASVRVVKEDLRKTTRVPDSRMVKLPKPHIETVILPTDIQLCHL